MDNHCPLCRRQVYQSIKTKSKVKDSDNFITSEWLLCYCGCVFNTQEYKPQEVFNEQYRKVYSEMKGVKDRQSYFIHVYAPLIEEWTYGRKFLDVGYCLDYNILEMKDRGWLATGIDMIENKKYHTGDFLEYDFKDERFDFIKMTDFLQCVKDPLKAIQVAYNLLYPNGLLFIETPDTDLIKDNFFPNWGHWNSKENRQFYNESILRNMLERVDNLTGGFDVKLIHRDISRRFVSWNTLHMIVQKSKREIA